MRALFAVVEPPNKNDSRLVRQHFEVHAEMFPFAFGIGRSDGHRLCIPAFTLRPFLKCATGCSLPRLPSWKDRQMAVSFHPRLIRLQSGIGALQLLVRLDRRGADSPGILARNNQGHGQRSRLGIRHLNMTLERPLPCSDRIGSVEESRRQYG